MKRSNKHKLIVLLVMGVWITTATYFGFLDSVYGFGYLWGAIAMFFIERVIGEY